METKSEYIGNSTRKKKKKRTKRAGMKFDWIWLTRWPEEKKLVWNLIEHDRQGGQDFPYSFVIPQIQKVDWYSLRIVKTC